MPNPDTVAIPVLAGAALAQGVTFLYGQATEVLHIRREGKAAERATLPVPAAFEPLGAELAPDLAELDARAGELAAVLAIADHYATRTAEGLDGADPVLRACFGSLREVLEAVYGTRFTFVGESRPRPRVLQVVDDVRAPTTGVKGRGPGADMRISSDVEQRVQTVHPGGELTGIDIDLRN